MGANTKDPRTKVQRDRVASLLSLRFCSNITHMGKDLTW